MLGESISKVFSFLSDRLKGSKWIKAKQKFRSRMLVTWLRIGWSSLLLGRPLDPLVRWYWRRWVMNYGTQVGWRQPLKVVGNESQLVRCGVVQTNAFICVYYVIPMHDISSMQNQYFEVWNGNHQPVAVIKFATNIFLNVLKDLFSCNVWLLPLRWSRLFGTSAVVVATAALLGRTFWQSDSLYGQCHSPWPWVGLFRQNWNAWFSDVSFINFG